MKGQGGVHGFETRYVPHACSRVHLKVYVPIAMSVLAALSLAPPLVSFLVLWFRRDRLHEIRMRKVG